MKLIVETIKDAEFLIESGEVGKAKSYVIRGPFMEGEAKNANGRVYPIKTLIREVEKYNDELVKTNRALGELCHPDNVTINLERVSHKITSLQRDGNVFIGEAKVLDTPYGKIVKNFMDEGIGLAVSSRAVGSIYEEDDTKYVQDNMQLITPADIVHTPSCAKAFVEGIMEGKEWIYENGLWKEVVLEKAKKRIKRTPSRKMEETILREFKKLLK